MGTTLKGKMAQLPSERRARIGAESDRLHAEYLTLRDIRKAKELTQVQLADALGIRQATVAQLEKRSDLLLSTLRSYVEAMGGRLKLMVEFPGRSLVALDRLGDTEEPLRHRKPGQPRALRKATRVQRHGCNVDAAAPLADSGLEVH